MQLKKILSTAVSVSIMATGVVASNSALLSSLIGNMTPTAYACDLSSGDTTTCIINNATVSSVTQDQNTSDNTATVSDIVCYSIDLATATTDTKLTINPLDTNSYTATITNIGPSTLKSASFTFGYNDTQIIDPTTVTVGSGALGSPTLTGTGATRQYANTITGLSVASGATVTVTFATSVLGSAVGTVTANFNVTPLDDRLATNSFLSSCPVIDTDLTNNPSLDNTSIVAQADLLLVKTSSGGSSSLTNTEGQFIKGAAGSYTLTATNNGPSIAGQPITIVDNLPANLTYTGFTSTGSVWTCVPSGSPTVAGPVTITCTNPNNLANGATATPVTLNVIVNA